MQRLYRLTPFFVISIMVLGLAGRIIYSKSFWMTSEGCGMFGFVVFAVIFVGFVVLILDGWIKKAMSLKMVWVIEAVVLLVFTLLYST